MRTGIRRPGLQWQGRRRLVRRLDLGFLIHAEHDGLLRRAQVGPTTSTTLGSSCGGTAGKSHGNTWTGPGIRRLLNRRSCHGVRWRSCGQNRLAVPLRTGESGTAHLDRCWRVPSRACDPPYGSPVPGAGRLHGRHADPVPPFLAMSDPLRYQTLRGGSSHQERQSCTSSPTTAPISTTDGPLGPHPQGPGGPRATPAGPLWRGERDPRESGRSARARTMPAYAATMPYRLLSADTWAVGTRRTASKPRESPS
jgi:hypothetical protein